MKSTISKSSSSLNKIALANKVTNLLARYGIVLAFFLLCGVLSLLSEYFLTTQNLSNILLQVSINGVMAIGMTFVILTGGIDLSVGSVLAFSGMVAASFVHGDTPSSLWVAIPMGMLVGAACGGVNGLLSARFNIPAFVVTLGMLSAARGLTQIYSNGMPISELSDSFLWIGQGRIFSIPIPVLILFSMLALSWVILRYTRFGRYVYAVGGNEKSARTSGISSIKVKIAVYAIAGLCSALAGLMVTARTTSALTQAGMGYELDAIAAVVIGGTSLSGGVGTIGGTLIGILIIGVINNGLDLLGVPSGYQQVIKGIVIALAVLLDRSSKRS